MEGMQEFQKHIDESLLHVTQALAGIRGGRATPTLVEDVIVEYYGSPTPLKHVATVSIPEPRTIAIAPWDKQVIPDVTKALEKADLGAMPAVHGEIIHVTLPTLTQERRAQIVKMIGKIIEEGRVAVRRIREETLDVLKKDKDAGTLSEDDFFRKKEEIEQITQKTNGSLAQRQEQKEQELSGV